MSNIPKSRRDKSEFEVFVKAQELRDELTVFALHDFGASKTIKKNAYVVLNGLSMEDKKTILEICNREKSNPVTVAKFPEWFLTRERETILTAARNLQIYITSANSIYPTILEELNARRKAQTSAIACCKFIEEEIYYISRVLQINLNKSMRVIELLETEVGLLKGWRKSDKRFEQAIIKAIKKDPRVSNWKEFVYIMNRFIGTTKLDEISSGELNLMYQQALVELDHENNEERNRI